MRVIYTPENKADGDPHDWLFDAKRVRSTEVERIEDLFGQTWPAFVSAVQAQGAKALRLLLWHLMRRDHPDQNIKIGDVPDFFIGEIELEASSSEIRDAMKKIESSSQFTGEERIQALAQGEIELAAALEREAGVAARAAAPSEVVPAPAAAAVVDFPVGDALAVPAPPTDAEIGAAAVGAPPLQDPSPTFAAAIG